MNDSVDDSAKEIVKQIKIASVDKLSNETVKQAKNESTDNSSKETIKQLKIDPAADNLGKEMVKSLKSSLVKVPSVEFCGIIMDKVANPTEKVFHRSSSPRLTPLRRASSIAKSLRRQSVVYVFNFWTSFRGIFYCLCSSLLYAITDYLVKQLTGIHLAFIALIRFNGQGILTLAALPEVTPEYIIGPKNARLLIFFRSLSVGAALYMRYTSVRLLPLAEATLTKMMIPAFVMIFARIFLKEKLTKYQIASFTLLMAGMAISSGLVDAIFIANNNDPIHGKVITASSHTLGLCCGLTASLIAGITAVILRKLKDVHHSAVLVNNALIGSIQMAIFAYFLNAYHLPECGNYVWYLIAISVFSYFGQVLSTRALQCEEAIIISTVKTCASLILSFLSQIYLLNSMPSMQIFIGASLMLIAVMITTLRKYYLLVPYHNPLKQFFLKFRGNQKN